MKKGRTDSDWAIVAVMTFCAGAVFAWALTSDPSIASRTKGIEWPAWVQAVGSVAAIGVAIYIPWRQKKDQSIAENRRTANLIAIMAGALYHPCESFRSQCAILRTMLDLPFQVRQGLPAEIFERPTEFNEFRSQLSLMGKLGVDVNVLISRQDDLRIMLKAFRGSSRLEQNFIDKAVVDLQRAEIRAERCRDGMKRLVDQHFTGLGEAELPNALENVNQI